MHHDPSLCGPGCRPNCGPDRSARKTAADNAPASAWDAAIATSRQAGAAAASATPATAQPAQFSNPVVAAVAGAGSGSADPSVAFHDGHYFYCRSLADGAVGVARAARLQDIGRSEMVVVWRPVPGTGWSDQIWAPELQRVQGRWHIYFAASDGDNRNHRMYVLQGETDDPQGSYSFRGKIAAPTDCWAIDGIVVEHADQLYFVWSGWRHDDDGFPQVLYIAPMRDPCTISGDRRELAAPLHAWEQQGAPLLEGPAVLYRGGRIFITYSASASWTDDYALGLLTFSGDDPLSADAWVRSLRPVFSQCPQGKAFGPGHNSFVPSPDGTEDWIVYHAIDASGGGWSRRSVRAQRIGWSADGLPVPGVPVACGVPVTEPAGSPRLDPSDMARLALQSAQARARQALPPAAACTPQDAPQRALQHLAQDAPQA